LEFLYVVDNTTFAKNPQRRLTASFNLFVTEENSKTALSPQLQLASFQYLSTGTVEIFINSLCSNDFAPEMLRYILPIFLKEMS
jgi:hypothetical protein